RAGQPLARTDAVQQQQVLAAAEAALAGARAAQEQAGQAAARASELLRRGIGTRAALDSAQQTQSAAQGQVEAARTEVDRARRALKDTILSAPQDAVVTARSAEPGQIVGAAQAIVTLAALTGLEAVFATPDAPQLDRALGAPVTLKPLDRPGLVLKATVTEIAPLVDPATASVTVRAAIMGAMDSSLLGAAVRGEVHLPAGTGIAVPWTALSSVGDEPAVWRVGPEGRAEIVPVGIERYQTGAVVLKSGVKVGDIIVGEGSQMLYPGRAVTAGKVRP
ncbi:MAG TPA: efflux RND transporter periplasmic adaptor subunit, partial [Paracoccus sp. (in: a-proteobacteria)]|nr:efflux RND transporter periplasmic adaptor subunit [Paracoccus sp. (in: a-proteobacteria)]